MDAKKRIQELEDIITKAYEELAELGTKVDEVVSISGPTGWSTYTLVNEAFAEEQLSNYGWEHSDESKSLIETFNEANGCREFTEGEWISSSDLC